MKNLLIVSLLVFALTSCNKCVECTHDDYEWTTWDGQFQETHGDRIEEICRDNFESKKDYKDYIDAMEDDDWDCKSDFWN